MENGTVTVLTGPEWVEIFAEPEPDDQDWRAALKIAAELSGGQFGWWDRDGDVDILRFQTGVSS